MIEYPKFRHEALDFLWLHCFSGPIKFYNAFNELENEETVWLRSFIANCISKCSELLAKYADIRYPVLIYLGDLYRYSWTLFGENEHDYDISCDCYKKAFKLRRINGQPFNQLALICYKSDPWKAVYYFMRAIMMPKPFSLALENISVLKNSNFTDGQQIAYKLITLVLSGFRFVISRTYNSFLFLSRIKFEEIRRDFDQLFDKLLHEGKNDEMLEITYILSMLTIFTIGDDKGILLSKSVIKILEKVAEYFFKLIYTVQTII